MTSTSAAADVKRFQGIIAMLQSDKNALAVELKLVTTSRDELQKKLSEREGKLNDKLREKEADVEALQRANNEQIATIESLRKRVLQLNDKLGAVEGESDSLRDEAERAKRRATEVEDAARSAANLANRLTGEVEQLREEKVSLAAHLREQQANMMRQREESTKARSLASVELENVRSAQEGLRAENKKISDVIRALMLELSRSNVEHDALLKRERKLRAAERLAVSITRNRTHCERTALNRWRSVTMAYALKDAGEFALGSAGVSSGQSPSSMMTVTTLTASSVAMSLRLLVRGHEQATSMLAASKSEMRKLASEYQSSLDKLAEAEHRVTRVEAESLLHASEAASERAKALLAAKHLKHLRNSLVKTTELAKAAIERRIQAAVNVTSLNSTSVGAINGASSYSSSSMSITPMQPFSSSSNSNYYNRSSLNSGTGGTLRLLDATPIAVQVSSSALSSRMSTGGGGALAAAFAAMGAGGHGGLPPRGPSSSSSSSSSSSVARFGAAKGAHRLLDPDGEAEVDEFVPTDDSSVFNNSHILDKSILYSQQALPPTSSYSSSSSSSSAMALQSPHRGENIINEHHSNIVDETESEAADPWIESAKILSHLHAEQQKSSLLARELENSRKECVTLESEVSSLLIANEAAKESESKISDALESEAQRRLQLQGIVKRLRLFYPSDVDATIAMVTQALRSSTKASSVSLKERKDNTESDDDDKASFDAAEALLFEFAASGSLMTTTTGGAGKATPASISFSPKSVSSVATSPLPSSSPNVSSSSSSAKNSSSLSPLSYLQRIVLLLHSRLHSSDVQLKEALEREARLRKDRNKLAAECETSKLRAAGHMTQLQSMRDTLASEESNAAASAASVEARLKILPALHAKLMEALTSVETHRKATADALAGHALISQEFARLESELNSLRVSLSEEHLLRSKADRTLLEMKEEVGRERAKFANALSEAKVKENKALMEADRVRAELAELEKSVHNMHNAHLEDLEKLTEAEENVARCRFEADEACSKASDLESYLEQEKERSSRALIEMEQNAARRLHDELAKCELSADDARRSAMSALAYEHEEALRRSSIKHEETLKRYSDDAERVSEEYYKELSSLKDELDALQSKLESAQREATTSAQSASVALQEKDRTLRMVADLEALGKTQNANLAAALSALQKREKDIEKLKVASAEAEAATARKEKENEATNRSLSSSPTSSSSNAIASQKAIIARLTSQLESQTSFCTAARSDLDAALSSLKAREDEVLALREQVAVLATRFGRTQADNLSVVQDCVRIGLESGALSKRIDALSSILAPALLSSLKRLGTPSVSTTSITTTDTKNAKSQVTVTIGIDQVQEMSRLLDPPSSSSSSSSKTLTRSDKESEEKSDKGDVVSSGSGVADNDDDSVQSRLRRALRKEDNLHSALAAASLSELRIALTQALDETANANESVSLYENRCRELTQELEGVYAECLRLTEEAVNRGDDVTALISRLREREDELADKEAAFAAVRAATDSPLASSSSSSSPSRSSSSSSLSSTVTDNSSFFVAPNTPRGGILATIFEAPNSEDSSASSHHSRSPTTIGSNSGRGGGERSSSWNNGNNRESSTISSPPTFDNDEDDEFTSATITSQTEPDLNVHRGGGGGISSILTRLGVGDGSSTPKTLRGKRAKLEPESPIEQSITAGSNSSNEATTTVTAVKLRGAWAEIFPEAAAAAASSSIDVASTSDRFDSAMSKTSYVAHSSSQTSSPSTSGVHDVSDKIKTDELVNTDHENEYDEEEKEDIADQVAVVNKDEEEEARFRTAPLTSMTIVNAYVPNVSVASDLHMESNENSPSPLQYQNQRIVHLDVKPPTIAFLDELSKPPSPTRRPPPPPSSSSSPSMSVSINNSSSLSSTTTKAGAAVATTTVEKKKAVHFSESPPHALSPPSPMTIKDHSSIQPSSSLLPLHSSAALSTTTVTSAPLRSSQNRNAPNIVDDGDDFFSTPKKRSSVPNPSSYSLFNDDDNDDAPTPLPRSAMPTMASLSLLLSTQQQQQQQRSSSSSMTTTTTTASRPYFKLPPVPVLAGPLRPLTPSSPLMNSERATAEQIAQAEFLSPTALEDRRKVAEILALLGEK